VRKSKKFNKVKRHDFHLLTRSNVTRVCAFLLAVMFILIIAVPSYQAVIAGAAEENFAVTEHNVPAADDNETDWETGDGADNSWSDTSYDIWDDADG